MSSGGSATRLAANVFDPLNISGQAGSSITGNILDPGGWWGLNQQGAFPPNPLNGSTGAITLPAPSGNVNPILYSPTSFMPRQPAGPGAYNAMAAQLAGPMYMPQALPTVVQKPAAMNAGMAAGGMSTTPLTPAQRLGLPGYTLPYNPKINPMVYAR